MKKIEPQDVIDGKVSLCGMRILSVLYEHPKDALSVIMLKENIKGRFGKDYRKELLEKEIRTLLSYDLVIAHGSNGGATYTTSDAGRGLITKIRRLESENPNPWRRFSRPTRSPNIATVPAH